MGVNLEGVARIGRRGGLTELPKSAQRIARTWLALLSIADTDAYS